MYCLSCLRFLISYSVLSYILLLFIINNFFLYLRLLNIFIGYPQPQYKWLRNGIPVGDFSSSQYLRILNTQRTDAASYKCIAKNDAGSIFSEKIDVVVARKYFLLNS